MPKRRHRDDANSSEVDPLTTAKNIIPQFILVSLPLKVGRSIKHN
jgi:hypothetical protein